MVRFLGVLFVNGRLSTDILARFFDHVKGKAVVCGGAKENATEGHYKITGMYFCRVFSFIHFCKANVEKICCKWLEILLCLHFLYSKILKRPRFQKRSPRKFLFELKSL